MINQSIAAFLMPNTLVLVHR